MNETRILTAALEQAWSGLCGTRPHAVAAIENEAAAGARAELRGHAYNDFSALIRRLGPDSKAGALFTPPGDAPTARLAQWSGSRLALAQALTRLLEAGVTPERLRFSLSHCPELSLAAAFAIDCAEPRCACRAGADVEEAARAITPRAAALFTRESEPALGLTPLQRWVIKEACYKANPRGDETIVAHYALNAYDTRSREGRASCDRTPGAFTFRLIETGGRVAALAVSSCSALFL